MICIFFFNKLVKKETSQLKDFEIEKVLLLCQFVLRIQECQEQDCVGCIVKFL